MLCAAWQEIFKHMESKYQARAKRVPGKLRDATDRQNQADGNRLTELGDL